MTNTATDASAAVLDLDQLVRQAGLQASAIEEYRTVIEDSIQYRGETDFLVGKRKWAGGFAAGYRAAMADVLESMQADPDAEARLQEVIERI